MAHSKKILADDEVEIFTPYFWHRGLNRRIYASQYGKTVFRFVVKASTSPR